MKYQSALEYLTTYGFAILIIAIVGVAIYKLGIFKASINKEVVSKATSIGNEILIEDYATNNTILTLSLISKEDITITSIKLYDGSELVGSYGNKVLDAGINDKVNINLSLSTGEYNLIAEFCYYKRGGIKLERCYNSSIYVTITNSSITKEWYYSYLSYRRNVSIENDNSYNLSNYQVKLIINYNSNMQSDFDDLRFTYYNRSDSKEYEIPYWIEEKYDGVNATVWIKVPFLESNKNETIYMYYGNDSISNENIFNETFTKNPDEGEPWNDYGLIAEYHLDEDTGDVAHDDASGYEAYLVNFAFTPSSGWLNYNGGQWDNRSDMNGSSSNFFSGSSLIFDGYNDRLNLSYQILDELTNLTFECWIKSSDNTFGLLSGANSVKDNEFLVYYSGSKIYVYVKGRYKYINENVADNKWHHIVIGRKGNGNILFYIDGNLLAERTGLPSSSLDISPNGLWIAGEQDNLGDRWDTNQQYRGIIDEIRFYNRTLSLDEVRAHYYWRKYGGAITYYFGSEESKD